jgi:hypothetical protein
MLYLDLPRAATRNGEHDRDQEYAGHDRKSNLCTLRYSWCPSDVVEHSAQYNRTVVALDGKT